MCKLIQKKENALLTYFVAKYTTQVEGQEEMYRKTENACEDKVYEESVSFINVEQLTELKGLSEALYSFAVDINNKVLKVEALLDLQEDHDEKYQRLFFKFTGPQEYRI
jgi:hypothetical protein